MGYFRYISVQEWEESESEFVSESDLELSELESSTRAFCWKAGLWNQPRPS